MTASPLTTAVDRHDRREQRRARRSEGRRFHTTTTRPVARPPVSIRVVERDALIVPPRVARFRAALVTGVLLVLGAL